MVVPLLRGAVVLGDLCETEALLRAPWASEADILHPALPYAKAVPTGLTLEGIPRGKTEEAFPEPSADALCPFITTVRT
jgi:hypothetical protein